MAAVVGQVNVAYASCRTVVPSDPLSFIVHQETGSTIDRNVQRKKRNGMNQMEYEEKYVYCL